MDTDNITQVASGQVVLGCIIEHPALLSSILSVGLHAEDFLLSDHQRAFAAILKLSQRKAPIDVLSVADELGGDQDAFNLVLQLIYGVIVEPKHAHYHAQRVKSYARCRRLLRISESIPQRLADLRDPDLLISEIREKLAACEGHR